MYSLIVLIVDGNVTLAKETLNANAYVPKVVTLLGIETSVRPEPKKAPLAIVTNVCGKAIVANIGAPPSSAYLEKAPSPIVTTDGTATEAKLEQSAKA